LISEQLVGKSLIFFLFVQDYRYHWYRLDANGFWSHKPGQTRATDLDGAEEKKKKKIKDPRKANLGVYKEFICFMTTDRGKVKIK